jgi:electron-transferring-flavoprotein dehydrogenase
MERVDVAIVGGGPGGSSTAWEAARAGADAVVIEKGVPRDDRDRLGPDSTDAAGMLDYWVDLMNLPVEFPESVKLARLDGTEFVGPNESVTLRSTGIDSDYPDFGFAFHRARFDDWLRDQATDAGAEYRVGTSVTDVATSLKNGPTHTLTLAGGDQLQADYLVLADGPQRTVTTDALDQFMPDGRSVSESLASDRANHIAYQEHRRMPEELFDPNYLKFWWGVMPGHTAYPWIFPNDAPVARIGLTMPIGMDIDEVPNRDAYSLLRPEDDQIPPGRVYVRRLLEQEFPEYDVDEDFPLVEDRGKRGGTEAYPISSTRPIESPTKAGIAVVGGAMGATSAFHEGGDHVAVRTGRIAGKLAATDSLERYNDEWERAIGEEVRRNVALAETVRGYQPDDWDEAFRVANTVLDHGSTSLGSALSAGVTGLSYYLGYKRTKFDFRGTRYVQLREDEYVL